MSKPKVISARTQVELMETLASASGSTSWEQVRQEMHATLSSEFGRQIELAPIPPKKESELRRWIEEEA